MIKIILSQNKNIVISKETGEFVMNTFLFHFAFISVFLSFFLLVCRNFWGCKFLNRILSVTVKVPQVNLDQGHPPSLCPFCMLLMWNMSAFYTVFGTISISWPLTSKIIAECHCSLTARRPGNDITTFPNYTRQN